MSRRLQNVVILTGSDCALLYEAARLRELRVAARGSSDRLYSLLTDITAAAFDYRDSLNGKKPEVKRENEEAGDMGIVTAKEVARRAGVTPRTVRNHIALGLLAATQQGRTWVITTESANQYIEGRKAA